MFKAMMNIDIAFRYMRMICIAVIACSFSLCGLVIYKSYVLATITQNKVYVLVNGKALEAYAAERKDNILVEAKDHVKTFHLYFFNLSPDDKAIEATMSKALYLADKSAKRQWDNLQESSYISNLISGNVTQTIAVDSISVDMNQYPFYFRCFATQEITRPTTSATRSLITEGYLRNTSRSDNNSHGFLIERWRVLENKDLKVTNR